MSWSAPRLTVSDLRTPVTVTHHLANTLRNIKNILSFSMVYDEDVLLCKT